QVRGRGVAPVGCGLRRLQLAAQPGEALLVARVLLRSRPLAVLAALGPLDAEQLTQADVLGLGGQARQKLVEARPLAAVAQGRLPGALEVVAEPVEEADLGFGQVREGANGTHGASSRAFQMARIARSLRSTLLGEQSSSRAISGTVWPSSLRRA